MARRKLSLTDQLKGVRKAVLSPRTPPQLRDGLRRRAEDLERRLGVSPSRRKKGRRRSRLRDFFSL